MINVTWAFAWLINSYKLSAGAPEWRGALVGVVSVVALVHALTVLVQHRTVYNIVNYQLSLVALLIAVVVQV